MDRRLLASLLVCSLLAGCAADGGSRGTGITGTVVSVRTASTTPAARSPRTLLAALRELLPGERTADAQSQVEGIDVMVEGTAITGRTDSNGSFSLRGGFGGPVALRFRRAADGVTARLAVNAPAGGDLALNGVHLDNRDGSATVDREDVNFPAIVRATDCSRETITVVSQEQPDDGNRYTVRIGSSSIHDRRGQPRTCQDLRGNENVRVQGNFESDGTVGGDDVAVED